MTEWQSINTAPKDGTWILALHPWEEFPLNVRAYRWESNWWPASGGRGAWIDQTHHDAPLEFWISLPKPPKESNTHQRN